MQGNLALATCSPLPRLGWLHMVAYSLTWLSACINPAIYCLTNRVNTHTLPHPHPLTLTSSPHQPSPSPSTIARRTWSWCGAWAASRPPRPRTSQSVAPPPLPAQRPVRRPTTASEKKSAARLAAAAREEPPTREALALPAWTAQDLESEGTEETEVTGVTDTLKLQEEPARGPGRLQVNLSGFPRQSIRLSADQAAGVTGLSIMLSQAVALPGAVEEHGSLQLEIEAPEVAAVHRPLALHGGQELRISN